MSLGTQVPSTRGGRHKCEIREIIWKHSKLTFKLEILVSTHYVLLGKKMCFPILTSERFRSNDLSGHYDPSLVPRRLSHTQKNYSLEKGTRAPGRNGQLEVLRKKYTRWSRDNSSYQEARWGAGWEGQEGGDTGIHIVIHFTVQQKLMQHCQAIIFQFYNRKESKTALNTIRQSQEAPGMAPLCPRMGQFAHQQNLQLYLCKRPVWPQWSETKLKWSHNDTKWKRKFSTIFRSC